MALIRLKVVFEVQVDSDEWETVRSTYSLTDAQNYVKVLIDVHGVLDTDIRIVAFVEES